MAPPHSATTVIPNPFSNGMDKRSDSVVLPRFFPEFLHVDWPLLDRRKVGDGKPPDAVDLVLRPRLKAEVLGDVPEYVEPGMLPGLMFEDVEMVEGGLAVAPEVVPGLFIDLPHGPLKICLPLVYLPLRKGPRVRLLYHQDLIHCRIEEYGSPYWYLASVSQILRVGRGAELGRHAAHLWAARQDFGEELFSLEGGEAPIRTADMIFPKVECLLDMTTDPLARLRFALREVGDESHAEVIHP